MDIKTLGYFLEICQQPSYAQAAKALYISPQGLHKAMRLLEDSLQVPLFEYTDEGRVLTTYGQCLYEFAQRAVRDYHETMFKIEDMARNKTQLRVGFSYGTIGSIGVSILGDFSQHYPSIEIIHEDFLDRQCEYELNAKHIDLGITVAPFINDKLTTYLLAQEPFYFWINKENPLSERESLSFSDLKDQRIMMVGKGFKSYDMMIRGCHRAGFRPNIVLTTSEMELLRQAVHDNQGIALTVGHETQVSNSEYVKGVLLEEQYWSYGISWLTGHELTEAEQCFVDYLIDAVNKRKINKKG